MRILSKIMLVLVIGIVAIISLGCGFCGAMGLITLPLGGNFGLLQLVLSAVGLAVAVGGFFAIRAMIEALDRPDRD